MPRMTVWMVCLAALLSPGCRPNAGHESILVIYNAASLASPMRSLTDTFARRDGSTILEEHGASLELARRITELHRIPDVIALADAEVIPGLLMPRHATWYATFARNRMVIAYMPRSRFSGAVTSANWHEIVRRPGVAFGRTDPVQAPAGYRALITFALAERFYRRPGLASALERAAPPSRVRANAADLAALLETGDLDYIIEYESLARSHGFSFVTLPPEIDLGDASHADDYAQASVRIVSGRDTVTRRGRPIEYALTIPTDAPHPREAERFAAFLLGQEGRRMLRAAHVDAVEVPEYHGTGVPPALANPR